MSGLSETCTCAYVDGYRIPSRSCPTHGPSMPPARPAHEDPLRLTFTRDELDVAVAAAREEAAAKIEALASSARVALAGPPPDCTGTCHYDDCNCSGMNRALAWDINPDDLRALAADIRKGDDR